MSALQRLIDELEGAAMEYAHECASCAEYDILQLARKAVIVKVAGLEQQLDAAKKDAASWRKCSQLLAGAVNKEE